MKSNDRFRYPIGQFEYGKTYTMEEIRGNMEILERFPKQLKKVLRKLRRDEYDVPYRQGGWTVRQVVHHLADSHLNGYTRMKLAVTETGPIIKNYDQDGWAGLEDGKMAPIRMSVRLLSALNRRWLFFIKSLTEEELEKGYFHPDKQRTISIAEAIALYAWHTQHHLGHIRLVVSGESYAEEGVAVPQQPDLKPLQQAGHRRFAAVLVDETTPKRGGRTKAADAQAAAGSEAPAPKRPGRPKTKTEAAEGLEAPAPKRPGRPKTKTEAAEGLEAPAPKRPGRPKMKAEDAEGLEVPVQKRPGRPKTITEAVEGLEAPTKKRPGRPKSQPVADATTDETAAKRSPGRPKVKTEVTDTTEGAPAKRRGRPKGSGTTSQTADQALSNGAENIETPAKKRPGRPKTKPEIQEDAAPKRGPGRPKRNADVSADSQSTEQKKRSQKPAVEAPVSEEIPVVVYAESNVSFDDPDSRAFE